MGRRYDPRLRVTVVLARIREELQKRIYDGEDLRRFADRLGEKEGER